MEQFMPIAGAYFWWIVAGALLLAEMMLPGYFMIWLGAAAALTGVAHFFFHLTWTTEVVIFAALSAALVAATWRWVRSMHNAPSDAPHLNQRHAALVGRTFVLPQPIIHGQGKIKHEDTLWDVDGPDLAAGERVKVTGLSGLRLVVEKA